MAQIFVLTETRLDCRRNFYGLSKAFNCLPHDLLVAKLEAYGLDTKTLKLMLSYLSGRKQCVKIRNSFSLLKLILFDITRINT